MLIPTPQQDCGAGKAGAPLPRLELRAGKTAIWGRIREGRGVASDPGRDLDATRASLRDAPTSRPPPRKAASYTIYVWTLPCLRLLDRPAGPETATDRAIRQEREWLFMGFPKIDFLDPTPRRCRWPRLSGEPSNSVLFKPETFMGANSFLNPVPGGWYLGVSCSTCDEMVLFAVDLSCGHGKLGFLEADEVILELCTRGHLTSFRLQDLIRFQWQPRPSYELSIGCPSGPDRGS